MSEGLRGWLLIEVILHYEGVDSLVVDILWEPLRLRGLGYVILGA